MPLGVKPEESERRWPVRGLDRSPGYFRRLVSQGPASKAAENAEEICPRETHGSCLRSGNRGRRGGGGMSHRVARRVGRRGTVAAVYPRSAASGVVWRIGPGPARDRIERGRSGIFPLTV